MGKDADSEDARRERASAGLVDRLIAHSCANRCMGVEGNRGGCCQVRERDYVIGPLVEAEVTTLLADLADHGLKLTRADVVIDFDEGREIFPERPLWRDPKSYPVMRIIKNGTNNACRFYEEKCLIHDIKPGLCRRYRCGWLQQQVAMIEKAPQKPKDPPTPAAPTAE